MCWRASRQCCWKSRRANVSVTATADSITGFTYTTDEDLRKEATATIAGDGSTVLKMYYTRNTYYVRYQYSSMPKSTEAQTGAQRGARNAQTGEDFDLKLHMMILCAAFVLLSRQIHRLIHDGFLPVKIADEAFQASHGRHRHVHHSRQHPGKKRPHGLLKSAGKQ